MQRVVDTVRLPVTLAHVSIIFLNGHSHVTQDSGMRMHAANSVPTDCYIQIHS